MIHESGIWFPHSLHICSQLCLILFNANRLPSNSETKKIELMKYFYYIDSKYQVLVLKVL